MAVVYSSSFETGVDHHVSWFSATVTQDNVGTAKTGTGALNANVTAAFYGIQLDNFPYYAVTAGASYDFSFWHIKASGATAGLHTFVVKWYDSGVAAIRTDNITFTPGASWAQAANTFVAPALTVTVGWTIADDGATTTGANIRFDDLLVQTTPVVTAAGLAFAPKRRRVGLPPRKVIGYQARAVTPVRAQVNPPYPVTETRGLKRVQIPRKPPRTVTPVRAQVNPPYPATETRGLRRYLLPVRRAKSAQVIPTQGAPVVNPAISQTLTGRVRRLAQSVRRSGGGQLPPSAPDVVSGVQARRRIPRYRRSGALDAPLAAQEVLPGTSTRRRAAGLSGRRRGSAASPVPTQLAITPNPSITATVFGRLRTVGRIQPRAKVNNPVPAQQAPAVNPAITATVFGRLRTIGRIKPRAKVNNPVPAQQAVTPNPPITATVFGRLRTIGRVRPNARVTNNVPTQGAPAPSAYSRYRLTGRVRPRNALSNPVPTQQAPAVNPAITATVFGRLRTVGRIRPRTKVSNPVPAQQAVTPNPSITATVFGRLRTVGRVRPPAKPAVPVPAQGVIPLRSVGRLRLIGRTNRTPRVSKPIPAQVNPTYPIRPSVGGLSGLRRVWLKVRRKNAYPVPPQVTTLSGPLTITDSYGGVGSVGGSSGGFSAESDGDNVAPTYDSDSDTL